MMSMVTKEVSAAPVDIASGEEALAVSTDVSVESTSTLSDLAEYLGVSEDEAIQQAIDRLRGADEANKKIVELFEGNPLAASILTTAADKNDFLAGLAANLSPEEYAEQVAALEDGSPAFIAKNERTNKLKTQKEREGKLQGAIDSSGRAFDEWVKSKGLTPEQVDKFEETIRGIAQVFEDMQLDANEYDKLWSWTDMDNILAQSVSDATIAARNEEKSQRRSKAASKTLAPIPESIDAGGEVTQPELEVSEDITEMQAIANRAQRTNNPFS